MLKINAGELAKVVLDSLPSREQVSIVKRSLADVARDEWIRLAQQELRTTARDYIQGISEVNQEGRGYTIVLTGMMPNMVEKGWKARNLRATLLGPNARNRKPMEGGGYYNTVPFRHAAPTSSGVNTGSIMPKSIHQVAKKLAPTISRHQRQGPRTIKYGGRLHAGMPMSHAARRHLTTLKKPHHSHPIHEGMIRNVQYVKGGRTQSSYRTFRRISTKGLKIKWNHPGIEKRNLASRVIKHVTKIGPGLVAATLRASNR